MYRVKKRILYYIDASVLLQNNQCRIFYILTSEDIDDVIYSFLHWIYIIKRKLHGGLKIWILSSRGENNILLIRKLLFSPHQIHIFAPLCNILYVCIKVRYQKFFFLKNIFVKNVTGLNKYIHHHLSLLSVLVFLVVQGIPK